ncbi:MAG: hypothetical protein EBW25_02640, partial [Actinobacteria bacterium]|nr:hypothetical protein [Actinomycetota bacterium]
MSSIQEKFLEIFGEEPDLIAAAPGRADRPRRDQHHRRDTAALAGVAVIVAAMNTAAAIRLTAL